MIKFCVVCRGEFKAPPTSKKVTCSSNCSTINKSKTHLGKKNKWNEEARLKKSLQGETDNLKLGTEAAKKSPIAGSFETNQEALIWTIKSPDGITYTVRNLTLFIKNNQELFDGTVNQAAHGFYHMKRTMLGKNSSLHQWKGWQLISWEIPEED